MRGLVAGDEAFLLGRAGAALHSLAQEAMDLLKSLSGKEAFAAGYMQVHRAAQTVRDRRRVEHAMEVRFHLQVPCHFPHM